MDRNHQLDLAISNGDASWCSCICGWVSTKTAEDDVQGMFAEHVLEHAFSSAPTLS